MDKNKDLQLLLDSFPNDVDISFTFDNQENEGIEISWSAKGTGFGSLLIYKNKTTNKIEIQTETMGKQFAIKVLEKLIEKATLIS